jgi:hypothetical protein
MQAQGRLKTLGWERGVWWLAMGMRGSREGLGDEGFSFASAN